MSTHYSIAVIGAAVLLGATAWMKPAPNGEASARARVERGRYLSTTASPSRFRHPQRPLQQVTSRNPETPLRNREQFIPD